MSDLEKLIERKIDHNDFKLGLDQKASINHVLILNHSIDQLNEVNKQTLNVLV